MTPNRRLAESIHTIATVDRTCATSIASSVTEHGPETRLDSVYGVFPKMVLGELNRHRGLSASDRSSRAVPPERLIEEVRSGVGLAMPARFRRRTTGMGGGEDLTGDELIEAQLDWMEDALDAADAAERASKREAKETTNRRLDPYIYLHTLRTGTRDVWSNFLGLRLHGDADPTIQRFAVAVYSALKGATPKLLRPGEWHLPFVSDDELRGKSEDGSDWGLTDEAALDLSAARCAHLSFNEIGTTVRMPVDRALRIAASLRDPSHPLHASPFEHAATPDDKFKLPIVHIESGQPVITGYEVGDWMRPEQHGNLYGWVQNRKTMPGEAVAALPDGYEEWWR